MLLLEAHEKLLFFIDCMSWAILEGMTKLVVASSVVLNVQFLGATNVDSSASCASNDLRVVLCNPKLVATLFNTSICSWCMLLLDCVLSSTDYGHILEQLATIFLLK